MTENVKRQFTCVIIKTCASFYRVFSLQRSRSRDKNRDRARSKTSSTRHRNERSLSAKSKKERRERDVLTFDKIKVRLKT